MALKNVGAPEPGRAFFVLALSGAYDGGVHACHEPHRCIARAFNARRRLTLAFPARVLVALRAAPAAGLVLSRAHAGAAGARG